MNDLTDPDAAGLSPDKTSFVSGGNHLYECIDEHDGENEQANQDLIQLEATSSYITKRPLMHEQDDLPTENNSIKMFKGRNNGNDSTQPSTSTFYYDESLTESENNNDFFDPALKNDEIVANEQDDEDADIGHVYPSALLTDDEDELVNDPGDAQFHSNQTSHNPTASISRNNNNYNNTNRDDRNVDRRATSSRINQFNLSNMSFNNNNNSNRQSNYSGRTNNIPQSSKRICYYLRTFIQRKHFLNKKFKESYQSCIISLKLINNFYYLAYFIVTN